MYFYKDFEPDGKVLRTPSELFSWSLEQQYAGNRMDMKVVSINPTGNKLERVYEMTVPTYTEKYGMMYPSIYINNQELEAGYDTSKLWIRIDYVLYQKYIDHMVVATQYLHPADSEVDKDVFLSNQQESF